MAITPGMELVRTQNSSQSSQSSGRSSDQLPRLDPRADAPSITPTDKQACESVASNGIPAAAAAAVLKPSNALVIGIAGGSASGKTSVSE